MSPYLTVTYVSGLHPIAPNQALQPTWQGAAKNCFNAFLYLSVKCLEEEVGPRG
jgi:hypothetical protein